MKYTLEDMRNACLDAAYFWPKTVSEYVYGDETKRTREQLEKKIRKMSEENTQDLFLELVADDVIIPVD